MSSPALASVTFFNGLQKSILSPNISANCDAALNTTLQCTNNVQYMLWEELSVGEP